MKCTIAILPIFIFFHVQAQVTIRNMSLIKPDSNILYKSTDNLIKVSGTTKRAQLISKNGSTVSAYDSNTFIVYPKSITPDTLLAYAGKELLLKKNFSIDTLPSPTITLGYIQHDTATVREILANKVLHAAYKGTLLNDPIQVLSFSTTFIGPDADTLNIFIPPVEGNMLTKEQEAIIKQLKKNSQIVFDAIIAITSNSKPRRLAPFVIIIK